MPLGEKALIEQIRRLAWTGRRTGKGSERTSRSAVRAGIGDDCAVLRIPSGHETLVTTDFSLEGIHFRRDWHSPQTVGHRCLARGLSDIAAMGGTPVAAFLSLALPKDLPQPWVDQFLRGLVALAQEHQVTLAGGDTAESPTGVLADIIVVGSVPRGKSILRSGARPGDRIYVSGELGGAATALAEMQAGKEVDPAAHKRHFSPEPRIDVGRVLREKAMATAMIDMSDGLSTDLAHICKESGVGANIAVGLIPRAKAGKPRRQVDLELALHGGEDYELLFTVRPSKKIPPLISGVPVTQIGVITKTPGITIRHGSGGHSSLQPRGWEHFRST